MFRLRFDKKIQDSTNMYIADYNQCDFEMKSLNIYRIITIIKMNTRLLTTCYI